MAGLSRSYDTLDELVADAADTLPQYGVVGSDRIHQWLDKTEVTDPGNAAWHLRRQHGFGGSEAGALIASWRGDFHPFSSAHDVIKQKLFLVPPEPEDDAKRRGRQAEDLIRQLFQAEYGEPMNLQRDGRANEAVQRASLRNHPWLVATPDELYRMPDGGYWLVDFKAPRPDILADYQRSGLPLDYQAQLHHYKLAADAAELDIQRMSVVLFDYEAWRPVVMDVPFSPHLVEDLVAAGDTFWNDYVLQDAVPRYLAVSSIDAEEVPAEVQDAADRFAASKRVERRAKREADSLKDTIEGWVHRTGAVPGKTLNIGDAQVRESAEPDAQRMLTRAQELGVNAETLERCYGRPDLDGKTYTRAYEHLLQAAQDYLNGDGELDDLREAVARAPAAPKRRNKPDADMLSEVLRQHGERPERYVRRQVQASITKKKQQPILERKARADRAAQAVIDDLHGREAMNDLAPDATTQAPSNPGHPTTQGVERNDPEPEPEPGQSGGIEAVFTS